MEGTDLVVRAREEELAVGRPGEGADADRVGGISGEELTSGGGEDGDGARVGGEGEMGTVGALNKGRGMSLQQALRSLQ
jgi:hypothetical protein